MPVPTNQQLLSKYSQLNSKACAKIERAIYTDLLEETRRIAPIITRLHSQVPELLRRERITKRELQAAIIERLDEQKLYPSMAGYHGFPAPIAISVNDELIHNLPDDTIIPPGAIVTVEISASSMQAYAHQVWSFMNKPLDQTKQQLFDTAKKALTLAMKEVADKRHFSNISAVIQQTIESGGYQVVREYGGYVMGHQRIMEPPILCYGNAGSGPVMQTDQILNILVLATDGNNEVSLKNDGWGVITKDGCTSIALSAMVLVTKTGFELLSQA